MKYSHIIKPDNFEPHNSLKLSFTNVRDLRSNFVEYEYFLESNSPDIHALCETNLDDSIDWVRGYFLLIRKDFYYSHVWFCTFFKRRTSFCMELISRKSCRFLLMLSTSITSLSALLFPIDHLLHCYAWFFILFHLT